MMHRSTYLDYTVMQLNGVANQLEFPATTGISHQCHGKIRVGRRHESLSLLLQAYLKLTAILLLPAALAQVRSPLLPGCSKPIHTIFRRHKHRFFSHHSQPLSFDTNGVERMSIDTTGTVAIKNFTSAGIVHNDASGNLSSSLIVNNDIHRSR